MMMLMELEVKYAKKPTGVNASKSEAFTPVDSVWGRGTRQGQALRAAYGRP